MPVPPAPAWANSDARGFTFWRHDPSPQTVEAKTANVTSYGQRPVAGVPLLGAPAAPHAVGSRASATASLCRRGSSFIAKMKPASTRQMLLVTISGQAPSSSP